MTPTGYPGQESHRDQVNLVMGPDGRRQTADPGAGDLLARSAAHIQSNPLDKIEAAEQLARVPVAGFLVAAAGEGLVHQVIAKHGRAGGAPLGQRTPEASLRRPALVLRETVIPRWNIRLAVAAQASQIEVKTGPLCQIQEFAEPIERLRVRPVGPIHELAELEMDADNVGPEPFHVAKIAGNRRPVRVPEILDQSSRVPVIEAPGREWLARSSQYKPFAILGHADTIQRSGLQPNQHAHKNQRQRHQTTTSTAGWDDHSFRARPDRRSCDVA